MAATTTPILAKIKKLLALSEGRGNTEAEASLAAEHVQRMLQDHGLTLAQVEAAGGGSDEAAKRERSTTGHRAMYAYQQTLMAAIAETSFCLHVIRPIFVADRGWGKKRKWDEATRTYLTGHRENRHVLVGRELNVAVSVQTYEYLIEALTRACPYDHRTTDGKLFLEGAAKRVAERLIERRKQREEEDSTRVTEAAHVGNGTHTELVLSDVYGTEADLNNDALNGYPAGTTATRRRDGEAKRAAQQAEHDRLVAEGTDSNVAWYRAYGYPEERAVELAKSFARTSRRGGRGRTHNWTRGDEAHYAKINSESYKAGRVAGASVGLDDQVSAARTRRIS
jgi:hypothetical protein